MKRTVKAFIGWGDGSSFWSGRSSRLVYQSPSGTPGPVRFVTITYDDGTRPKRKPTKRKGKK